MLKCPELIRPKFDFVFRLDQFFTLRIYDIDLVQQSFWSCTWIYFK